MTYEMEPGQQQRLILTDREWVGAGQNLPAAPPYKVVNGHRFYFVPGYEPEPAPETLFTADDHKHLVIKLGYLMGSPIQRVKILGQCERVFLVEFVPHYKYDPVLPVTFLELGADHNDAFRRLAQLIIAWEPDRPQQQQWYNQCKLYAGRCIAAARETLTKNESDYFMREMLYTISNPDRRDLGGPVETPEEAHNRRFFQSTGRMPHYHYERYQGQGRR